MRNRIVNLNKLFTQFTVCIFLIATAITSISQAGSHPNYHLFKNSENFGVVIFPPPQKNSSLEQLIQSLGFIPKETGEAVFRYGSKKKNGTYMMPESIQKNHKIEKFIVIQMLSHTEFLVGIFDPEWGLTMPQVVYMLKDLKKNIPKTLKIFRGQSLNQRETKKRTFNFLYGFATIATKHL